MSSCCKVLAWLQKQSLPWHLRFAQGCHANVVKNLDVLNAESALTEKRLDTKRMTECPLNSSHAATAAADGAQKTVQGSEWAWCMLAAGDSMLEASDCAAFGWDSCDKGGWYKILKDKVPDMKVRGAAWGI